MSLLSKKAVVLLVAALAGFGAFHAQAAKKMPAPRKSRCSMASSLLCCQRFHRRPAADQPERDHGHDVHQRGHKTVVITAENKIPEGQHVKDNDGQFLDGSVASFIEDQRKALPDFNKLSEKSLTQKAPASACVRSTAPPPRAVARPSTPR